MVPKFSVYTSWVESKKEVKFPYVFTIDFDHHDSEEYSAKTFKRKYMSFRRYLNDTIGEEGKDWSIAKINGSFTYRKGLLLSFSSKISAVYFAMNLE